MSRVPSHVTGAGSPSSITRDEVAPTVVKELAAVARQHTSHASNCAKETPAKLVRILLQLDATILAIVPTIIAMPY